MLYFFLVQKYGMGSFGASIAIQDEGKEARWQSQMIQVQILLHPITYQLVSLSLSLSLLCKPADGRHAKDLSRRSVNDD